MTKQSVNPNNDKYFTGSRKATWIWIAVILVVFYSCELIAGVANQKHHQPQHQGERIKDGHGRRDGVHFKLEKDHDFEFDHEVMVGSVKRAQQYHSMPASEAKSKLQILISTQVDINHDRYVDKHELKAHILRSFKSLSEEEANDRFDEVDEDMDDYVTWAEYIKEMYDMDSEDEPNVKVPVYDEKLESENKLLVEDDRVIFFTADVDKDGKLDRDEFVYFISPEEHPIMLPIILNQTLRDKDTDKDGVINFQEFLGDSARDHDKSWLIAEKERFDSEYDKNGDGLLSGNEILSWIVPSNDDVATDEVNHLFAAADVDHDNRLSYIEIIDNHELFVGSEVTDYGDSLHAFNDEL